VLVSFEITPGSLGMYVLVSPANSNFRTQNDTSTSR